jgi:hypothetical protein
MKSHSSSLSPISWEALAFPYREKTPLWYTNVMVFYALIILAFFFLGNYYAIAIVSGLTWYFLTQANAKPKVIHYKIDINGITLDKRTITFAEIQSFSIDTVGRSPIITIDLTQSFAYPVILVIKKQDFEDVIEALSRFVPFEKKFSIFRWLTNRLHY